MKYLYNPPYLIKKLFSGFYWGTANNQILLTFDDGPTQKTTEDILTVLKDNKIKALFFCVGKNIVKYPSLSNQILSEGHDIGNHTMNHSLITKTAGDTIESEITGFNNLLKQKHNYNVVYFRPPHGRFKFNTGNMLRKYKLKNIMWSLLTYDYKNDITRVKSAVENYLNKNSIIVLHDSLKSTGIIVDSVKFIIDTAHDKGFKIGEPAECLN